jgi:hypothetical protein
MTGGMPELTKEFRSGLEQLDMIVPKRPESSGLVFAGEIPQDKHDKHEYNIKINSS